MADLRQLALRIGLRDPRTYIQSGNLLVRTEGSAVELEASLTEAIAERFELNVPVIVRSASQWRAMVAACAFPQDAEERPKQVHAGLCKRPPASEVAERLAPYIRGAERVAPGEAVLWLDYADGVARSKLTARVLDRAVGSSVTCRNWRTVQRLLSMLDPPEATICTPRSSHQVVNRGG